MNKYLLMMAAAALAASTAAADASGGSGRINLASYCSYFDVQWQGPIYAVKQVGALDCNSNSTILSVGVAASNKDPNIRKRVFVGYGDANEQGFGALLALSLPLKTGSNGTYVLFGTTNGSTTLVLNSGPYNFNRQRNSNSHTSLAMKVKELLAAHSGR